MFPKFTLTADYVKFDGGIFGLKLGEHFNKAMRVAARSFLIEAVKRIPVRTGFLRGSFGNLEDIIGTATQISSKQEIGKITDKNLKLPKGTHKLSVKGNKVFAHVKKLKINRVRNKIEAQIQARTRQLRTLFKRQQQLQVEPGKYATDLKKKYRDILSQHKETLSSLGQAKEKAFSKIGTSSGKERAAALKQYNDLRKAETQAKQAYLHQKEQGRISFRFELRQYKTSIAQATVLAERVKGIQKRISALRDLAKRKSNEHDDLLESGKKTDATKAANLKVPAEHVHQQLSNLRLLVQQQKIKDNSNILGLRNAEYYQATKGGTKILKTPTSGRQFSTPSGSIFTSVFFGTSGQNATKISNDLSALSAQTGFNFGPKVINTRNTQFSFNFAVDIRYYDRNDVLYGWLSWPTAIAAFKRTLQQVVTQKLPKVQSYIEIVKSTYRTSGSTTGKAGKLITFVSDLGDHSSEREVNPFSGS